MSARQWHTGKSRRISLAQANNTSSESLVRPTDENNKELDPNTKGVPAQSSSQEPGTDTPKEKSLNHVSKTQWVTVAILTYVNLINYMDRYTIAG
jgi:hypothetical protein